MWAIPIPKAAAAHARVTYSTARSLPSQMACNRKLPHHFAAKEFLEALVVRAIPFPEQLRLLQHLFVPA